MMTPFEAYEILGFDQSMDLSQGSTLVMAMVNKLVVDHDLERLALVQEAWETVKPYLFSWSNTSPTQPVESRILDSLKDEAVKNAQDLRKARTRLTSTLLSLVVKMKRKGVVEEKSNKSVPNVDIKDLVVQELTAFSLGIHVMTDENAKRIEREIKATMASNLTQELIYQGQFLLEINYLNIVLNKDLKMALAKLALKETHYSRIVTLIGNLPDSSRYKLHQDLKGEAGKCPKIFWTIMPALKKTKESAGFGSIIFFIVLSLLFALISYALKH